MKGAPVLFTLLLFSCSANEILRDTDAVPVVIQEFARFNLRGVKYDSHWYDAFFSVDLDDPTTMEAPDLRITFDARKRNIAAVSCIDEGSYVQFRRSLASFSLWRITYDTVFVEEGVAMFLVVVLQSERDRVKDCGLYYARTTGLLETICFRDRAGDFFSFFPKSLSLHSLKERD